MCEAGQVHILNVRLCVYVLKEPMARRGVCMSVPGGQQVTVCVHLYRWPAWGLVRVGCALTWSCP